MTTNSQTITLVTTHGKLTVNGTAWATDKHGDCHVYDDTNGSGDPVASVQSDAYVTAFRGVPDQFEYDDVLLEAAAEGVPLQPDDDDNLQQ